MRADRDDDRDEFDGPRKSAGGRAVWILAGGVGALVLLAVGGWFLLGGGGETNAQVQARYRQPFADLRAKLKRVAANLPPPGSVQGDTLPPSLDPKPAFDAPNRTFNTALLMASQLTDPDRELRTPGEIDLSVYGDDFRRHLLWTGDRNPMVESARKQPAKDLARQFEKSLATKYLVVGRPVRYDPPQTVNENTFAGGNLDLEVFLVDLQSEKPLGAFRGVFRPDPQVMVTFRSDRQDNETAEAFVYSNLVGKARTEVMAALARGTRGTFAVGK